MSLFIKKHIYYIFFFIIIMSTACSNSNDNLEKHIRSEDIPKAALWVGGSDGGVYVEINKKNGDKPGIYSGVIYHSSGSIDYKGKLSINSTKNPDFRYKISESYVGWDGDTLYLKDGRALKIFTNTNNESE